MHFTLLVKISCLYRGNLAKIDSCRLQGTSSLSQGSVVSRLPKTINQCGFLRHRSSKNLLLKTPPFDDHTQLGFVPTSPGIEWSSELRRATFVQHKYCERKIVDVLYISLFALRILLALELVRCNIHSVPHVPYYHHGTSNYVRDNVSYCYMACRQPNLSSKILV